MKNYLDLIPISQRIHRRQSRMVRLCIILSVFLVTAIFGMADMEIRSQNAQAKINYGEWHAAFLDVSDEEVGLISQRPKVLACTRYGTLNYRLSMHYQVEGKETVIIGFDEAALDIFPTAKLTEGSFPKEEGGVVIDENMRKMLSLDLGDEITLVTPDGSQRVYHITGFFGQFPMLAKQDVYGLALTTEEFRKLSLEGAEDNYDSFIYVKLSSLCNIQKEIREIQEQFRIPDEKVRRNELLLATMGQSKDVSMMSIYAVALVLAILVSIAGILMITGSLSSNIAQRTEFFGMLCCLGASKEQVIRFVRREAMYWCKMAVPVGALLGTVIVWILSAVLRYLSPTYFGEMPYFGISFIGLAAGSVIGVITVFLAAGGPAKKAASVSPLTAVSGNASAKRQIKKAANTRIYQIETALGIHHALGSRKNFILMSCSFAFSIILFLSFSVAVDFMRHAIN
ncbi:MAG: ABC transporter permease, partial [Lachnospiraceae bacterium]|nr:ABC transporter permease [Lachnospiraceae bacterium]